MKEPVICNNEIRVATVGDAAIPEDSVVHKHHLLAVVFLIALAVFTIQT